jgi:hypothetical protein
VSGALDIRFFVYPAHDDHSPPGQEVLGAAIDGVDLRRLVADATEPLWRAEGDPEGVDDGFVLFQHEGLPRADVGWPSRHFLGDVADHYGGHDDGEVPLLGCACGIWGCWPMLARIVVAAATVTWADFRQPFRSGWGILPIGPLAFDRTAYEASLAHPRELMADPLRMKGSRR